MGLLDKIKGIPTNPLAMAGLGLLSMPTRSRFPLNPLNYAMQGMQAGVQNQQMQAEAEARKQQMEQQKAAYALQVAQYTRKAMAENEALVKQKQQESALAEWAASQPPEIQKFALAAPEAAMRVYAESLKPKDAPTQVQTYMLAHPEDKALKGFDQWVRANKASGASSVNVNTGGAFKVPSGYMLNADGTGVVPIPGIKPTEGEAAAGNYANRMQEANALLTELESKPGFDPADLQQNTASKVPMVGNYALTPDFRNYQQAKEDWVRAKLRKESGAVIAKEEMDKEISTYFPVPGDDATTIQQKRRAREIALEGMKKQSGAAAPSPIREPSSDGEGWTTLPNGVQVRRKR